LKLTDYGIQPPTFFLIQAFHALIPTTLRRGGTALEAADDGFARAHRAAEAAVRRLSSTTH
jgi:hypothetical protein